MSANIRPIPDCIDNLNNSCTLRAVRNMTALPDTTIINAFMNHNYRPNKGMYPADWIAAARDLGLQMEKIDTYVPYQERENKWSRFCYLTLGQFIKKYPVGDFFITVYGHALIVRNGKVIDSNRVIGLRRQVREAHRVLNATAPAAPKHSDRIRVVIPSYKAKRRNSASYLRYVEMTRYLYENQTATIQDLLAHTTYTKADLAHDLGKGLVEYI